MTKRHSPILTTTTGGIRNRLITVISEQQKHYPDVIQAPAEGLRGSASWPNVFWHSTSSIFLILSAAQCAAPPREFFYRLYLRSKYVTSCFDESSRASSAGQRLSLRQGIVYGEAYRAVLPVFSNQRSIS